MYWKLFIYHRIVFKILHSLTKSAHRFNNTRLPLFELTSLKEHSYGILSYFDNRLIEGNLKIILHKDRKTLKR